MNFFSDLALPNETDSGLLIIESYRLWTILLCYRLAVEQVADLFPILAAQIRTGAEILARIQTGAGAEILAPKIRRRNFFVDRSAAVANLVAIFAQIQT